jgi:hypothetical protein
MIETLQTKKLRRIQIDLLRGEKIIWVGQPVARRMFRIYDAILIPFSLMWCALLILLALRLIPRLGWLSLCGLPHLLGGFYLLGGRFAYDYWRRRRTVYTITDRRILINTGKRTLLIYIYELTGVDQARGYGNVGSITFHVNRPARRKWWQANGTHRTRSQHLIQRFGGYDHLGFTDVSNVRSVHRLLNNLRKPALRGELMRYA